MQIQPGLRFAFEFFDALFESCHACFELLECFEVAIEFAFRNELKLFEGPDRSACETAR